MSGQQQPLDQRSKCLTFDAEYILQSHSGVCHGAVSLVRKDLKLFFSNTNPMPITTDEFAYVLPVRLRSPPVNDRVENGVRRFDKRLPYFKDHHYTSAVQNYYAN